MALKTRTRDIIGDNIRKLDDFRRGNVSGGRPHDSGRLPEPWGAGFRGDVYRGRIQYAIYSYGTPIAWLEWRTGGMKVWVVPPVRYSVTTTQHQNAVLTELRTAGISPGELTDLYA